MTVVGIEIFTLISYDKGFSSDEDAIALFEMFFIIFNIRAYCVVFRTCT